MSKITPLFTTTAIAVGLSFALTACGGGDKPAKEAEKADAPAEKARNKASGKVELAEVQEITLNNGSEPQSLDPHKVSGVPEGNIIRQMIEGLTTTDPEGNTVPGIAESWETADNKVWKFKLRDAKWTNGEPVTAEDFVYSWRRLVNPETASPYASYLADVKLANAQDIIDNKAKPDTLGVKALDDKTLEVTLTEPVPYFPDTLIHTSVKPVHKGTVEKFGDKWTSPENIVVNGAYKLSDWAVNDKIVLERNPDYYNNAKTTINKITLLPITSDTTALTRYKAGELDVAGIPSEQYDQVKKDLADEVYVGPSLCVYYYEFNTEKKPFDDVRVRKALSMALERDIITDKVLRQGQLPAYQFTPPSTQGNISNKPEWSTWDKEKRVTEAKKLLEEAGFNESNPLEFKLLYNTNEAHKKIAVAATELWKKSLGNVKVELENQEWKTFLDTRHAGNFDVSRAGWCADYNEPSTFLNILKSGNSNNTGRYSSTAFDGFMSETLKPGVDTAKRLDLYTKAEVELDKDMPVIPVYHYVKPNVYKPYLINFPKKDPQSNWQIKDVQIAKH